MKFDVAVTGGGASGMMAAITAARRGAKTAILEQNDRLGKKLLSTGNGKCNYTNENQDRAFFHSEQPEAVNKVLSQFPLTDTLAFFRELGVLPLKKKGGFYPNCEQASAVLDALRFETERLGVHVFTNAKVKQLEAVKEGFRINFSSGSAVSRRVILAAGSKASAISGCDGSGYGLAEQLGHRIIEPLPALVQLRCAEDFYKGLQGVRMQAKIQLFAEETAKKPGADAKNPDRKQSTLLAEEKGELQLTGYGVSGIPVFQVSRFASRALNQGLKVRLRIDFLPELSKEEVLAELKRLKIRKKERKMEDLLTGMVHKKLAVVLLKCCQIKPSALCGQTEEKDIVRLARELKEFSTRIAGTNGFREAQVCCGGIDLAQIDGESLMSRKVPGLYFAGECLDVDGACGGYNLQWAWASGFVAGSHAAKV